MRNLRARAGDALIVVAITAFIALASQRWTGLDTPDSSFYASLGLFGDDVTDRAYIQSYYWTRLGVIGPVHLLTSVLGTWGGFAAFRVLLIAVIATSLYVALRVFASRITAAAVTTLLMTSTVLLAYLGNPYLTGSVLAGTAVVIACGLFDRTPTHALAGAALGWLAMVNPPGALLGASVWVAMRVHAALRVKQRPRLAQFVVGVAAAIVTFGAYLVVGRFIFPRMNWIETYLTWNAKLNYSVYASREPVWLHDISLLVPLAVLVIAIGGWLLARNERWAQAALLVSATSVGFMLAFSPLMGGIALEAPMYQAMLWPPALLAFGFLVAGRIGQTRWSPLAYVAAVVGLVAVVIAGHWPGAMSYGLGLLVAAGAVAVVILAVALWPRVGARTGTVVLIAALAAALASGQLLQNSRRSLGLYYLSPYSNAYNDNPISDKIHAAVNAQEWLLSLTSDSDRILVWVDGDWVGGDRELYVVAGMQLWGENRVTLEKAITPEDLSRLREIRPTVIQMVGPTMDGISRFRGSLPADVSATPLQCYDFTWPTAEIPTGHSCLTHLRWPVG